MLSIESETRQSIRRVSKSYGQAPIFVAVQGLVREFLFSMLVGESGLDPDCPPVVCNLLSSIPQAHESVCTRREISWEIDAFFVDYANWSTP
jgi:hypothetical protein